jgi:CheY-like chemotaxis protein
MRRIRHVNREQSTSTGDSGFAHVSHDRLDVIEPGSDTPANTVPEVLLYEPDTAMRTLLEQQLHHLGHGVAQPGGDYAVALIEPASPEGLRAARDLREREPATPLVLVSALPPSAETLELAPVAHLVKPVALDDLREALARCSAPPS